MLYVLSHKKIQALQIRVYQYLNIVLILDGPDTRVVGIWCCLEGRNEREVKAKDQRGQFTDTSASSFDAVHFTCVGQTNFEEVKI